MVSHLNPPLFRHLHLLCSPPQKRSEKHVADVIVNDEATVEDVAAARVAAEPARAVQSEETATGTVDAESLAEKPRATAAMAFAKAAAAASEQIAANAKVPEKSATRRSQPKPAVPNVRMRPSHRRSSPSRHALNAVNEANVARIAADEVNGEKAVGVSATNALLNRR